MHAAAEHEKVELANLWRDLFHRQVLFLLCPDRDDLVDVDSCASVGGVRREKTMNLGVDGGRGGA